MGLQRQERVEHIEFLLREQGCRITPQRMAVVRALVCGSGHATIEQVYAHLLETLPMLSLATVYKTVNLLIDLGEAIEIGSGEAAHYDVLRPYPHPHITCTCCGAVSDVPLDKMADLQSRAAETTGFEKVTGRLEFWGVCPVCSGSDSQGAQSGE